MVVRNAAAAAGLLALLLASPALATVPADTIKARAAQVQPKVVAWRRDLHQHPELGNREFRTAELVADHLRSLGLEVREGVGTTGVVGVLEGGKPGKTVALRADMDALPVAEETGLPFASKATGEWEGKTVGLMHACGHDTHVAMLMGAAEVLAGLRAQIPGTVVFIFQPAEEGPPIGEPAGAAFMIEEGALENPRVDAIFGLHSFSQFDSGELHYRAEGIMASVDKIQISLKGKQTHGAYPWNGVDITALAADVIQAVNQIAARRVDVAASPSVATIATVNGGVRHNIIPDEMVLTGTLRTFAPERRKFLMVEIDKVSAKLAEAYGATAKVEFLQPYPTTFNDKALSARVLPWLQETGAPKVNPEVPLQMGGEDFSEFQLKVPGVFYFLGVGDPAVPAAERAPNHSPRFMVHEPAMEVGVRAHVLTALRYLESGGR
jgi:amidohydrolase